METPTEKGAARRSVPCTCGGVMFGDGNAHTPTCPAFAGEAHPTPPPAALAPERTSEVTWNGEPMTLVRTIQPPAALIPEREREAFRAGFVANIVRQEGEFKERRVWGFDGGAHTAEDLEPEAFEQWQQAAPPPARAEAPEGAYDPSCADCRREAGRPAAGVPDDARCVWHLRAEIARLTEDQQDWRKGVALIASALGDPADNLSCVRIAEIALQQRAALEQAEAERDQQAGALVTLREALEKLPTTNGSNLWHKGTPKCYEAVYLKADVDAALAASAPEQEP